MKKIYLDIDGTLIHESSDKYGQLADGVVEFLTALRPYDTYWLTTHCMDGNPEHARRMMKTRLPIDLHADIDRIKPTVWKTLKTEALDFNSDFIWFDNDVFDGERQVLMKCNANQWVVEIDLDSNPRQLLEVLEEYF